MGEQMFHYPWVQVYAAHTQLGANQMSLRKSLVRYIAWLTLGSSGADGGTLIAYKEDCFE